MSEQRCWLGILLIGLLAMMLIGGAVLSQPEQPDPTAQHQTQDAIIQGYFQGTATAQAVQASTATLAAAFSAAQTATAQVDIAQTATFSAAQTATWEASNPDFIVDNLEVIAVEEFPLLAGPIRTSAYLAPNGERFAHLNGDEICIYTIQGVQQRCVSLDQEERSHRPDPERITWSPNSRYLAMESQDFLRTFYDSDLLILDADTGTLTNITDDGADCSNFFRPDEACASVFDLLPTWMPEGNSLLFNRLSRVDGTWVNTIHRIDVDGSGEEPLGALPVQSISHALDVAPDGGRIAFNFDAGNERRDGLWVSSLNGRRPQQIFTVQERYEVPFEIAFSPDGQYLLTVDARLSAFQPTSDPQHSPVRVTAVDGGTPTLLDSTGLVYGAGWSPYGSALAYVIFDSTERNQGEPVHSGLYLTNAPGEPGRRVLPGFFILPTSLSRQALTWGANNTILLTEPGQPRLFAVQLGEQ
jgi:Tol biopolymer transport system component